MVGKRLLYIFEILILVTLFAFFSSFVVTTNQNDAIVDETEQFSEMVRYKGCITEKMYTDFLKKMPTPVKIGFQVTKGKVLETNNSPISKTFTNEIFESIEAIGYYPMRVGDEIQVTVRKTSPTYFDKMVELMTRKGAYQTPIIAIKGGLILNEQYR